MGAKSILCAALAMYTNAYIAAQQEPPQVVVVAGPGEPRQLLGENLRGADFFVYDVALLMDERIDALVVAWESVEADRIDALSRVVAELSRGAGGGTDPLLARNRSIAQVARVILAQRYLVEDPAELLGDLTADERTELDQVVAGHRGTLHFVTGTPEVGWEDAVPVGAYARLPGLFRATVYLRTCLDRMPAAQRRAWDDRVQVLGELNLAPARRSDELLARLFGPFARTWSPGLGGVADLDDRERIAAGGGLPWQRLQRAIEPAPPSVNASLRSALLDVFHELSTETPDDELLQPLGLPWWRTKWLDCAQWGYVGMSEIDALTGVCALPKAPDRPRLLVEPLPRTLRAFERLDALAAPFFHSAAHAAPAPRRNPLLAALEAQRKGEDPPADVVDALIESLVPDPDPQPPTHFPVALPGLPGTLRRSGTYLLRVPIRWRGEPKTALVLHHFVEHAETAGRFQPPPWGIDLRQGPLPFRAAKQEVK